MLTPFYGWPVVCFTCSYKQIKGKWSDDLLSQTITSNETKFRLCSFGEALLKLFKSSQVIPMWVWIVE